MSLGNWEDSKCGEAKSEYLVGCSVQGAADYGELFSPHERSPFFAQVAHGKEIFMKNKKNIIAVLLLVLLVAVAAICWFLFAPDAVAGSKTIEVDVTHGDGSVKTFEIHTDEEFLRGALEQEGLISGMESEYGLYLLTVDGETVDEANQEWWGYTKSGEQVNYGVDTCPILDGEHYEFIFNVGW